VKDVKNWQREKDLDLIGKNKRGEGPGVAQENSEAISEEQY